MDKRLKLLSYSGLLTLHSCPRRFQLHRLNSKLVENEDDQSGYQKLTFAYGHTVGQGVQDCLLPKSTEPSVIFKAFLEWEVDLLAANPKQAKSFAEALLAIQRFQALREQGLLEEYELLSYKGVPACELGFQIDIMGAYVFRGSIDAVLRHKITGEIVVLEVKTTSSTTLNAASYKNSAQALGYSVILDTLVPGLSSYKVLYLVYKTKTREWEILEFTKSMHQRALWIRELLLDCDTISMYEEAKVYPMRGESCYSYYRECEYMGICSLDTSRLITAEPDETEWLEKVVEESVKFPIKLTLDELIAAQLEDKTEDVSMVGYLNKNSEEGDWLL